MPGRAFIRNAYREPGDDRKNVAKLWELAEVEGPSVEKGFSMLTAALKKKLTAHRKEAAKTAKETAKKILNKKKKG
jgi:hypothetical protein